MAFTRDDLEGDPRDVLDIDRSEPGVTERQTNRPFSRDRPRFAKVGLHELARTQVRPFEPGALQVTLDVAVQLSEAKRMRRPVPATKPGEHHDVRKVTHLCSVA